MGASATACAVYITMLCNGITLGTNSAYWGYNDKDFAWTTEQQVLVTHMFSRAFNGHGTVQAPVPPLYSCTSVTISRNCGNIRTVLEQASWPVDSAEATLISQIWGDSWGAPNGLAPKVP